MRPQPTPQGARPGALPRALALLCLGLLALSTPALSPPAFAQADFGDGPVPLEDPRALHEWGNRMRDREGCTLAESAWLRVVQDSPESEWAPPSLYNLGVCQEFDMDWAGAIAYYERLIDAYPQDPLIKDARFRRGLVMEELGDYRGARKAFRQLLRDRQRLKLSLADQTAAAIIRDTQTLKLGRLRRGSKALLGHIEAWEALNRDAQEPLTYWIARAQIALGQALSTNAASIPVTLGPGGRFRAALPWNTEAELLGAQLGERGRDLLAAQARYQAAIALQQPRWTLAAIYYMGRDYEILYRDMVDAPAPKGLDAEAAEAYLHGVADKAWPILLKAYRLYAHGDDLGRSFGLPTHYRTLLAERRRALDLEGVTEDGVLDPPPELRPPTGSD